MKMYMVLYYLFMLCFIPCIAAGQTMTIIAGKCDSPGYSGNYGPATNGKLRFPRGVTVDHLNNIYVADMTNTVVRKINPDGIITTYAGNGVIGYSGDGGQATNAELATIKSIAVDKNGSLYIADGTNNRVRKVDVSGNITTIAGNGTTLPTGDGGLATAAGLGVVHTICFDTAGNMYIYAANFIRKVNTAGLITKYAGSGIPGYSGDGGNADTAKLINVDYMNMDANGNLYFGTQNRIRKISATGIITTIAGDFNAGYSGDFGPATAAKFQGSGGVFPDSCGNLYVADYGNNVVRIINAAGKVYTIAGTGSPGCAGDGEAATSAQLDNPTYVHLDKNNDLYISDHDNHCIRKIHLPRCDSLVFPSSVAGVDNEKAGMQVFPNPTDGNALNIKINTGSHAPVQVAILSMVGAVVRQYTLQPGKETPLQPHLPPGMYMVVATLAPESGASAAESVMRCKVVVP